MRWRWPAARWRNGAAGQRAKWLLVSRHGLSEQAAHDQLQRVAMDRRRSLDDVARQVLAELDEAPG
ncbi:ANTAR domain-containing protein [Achromobacter xylosoxidans]